MFRITSLLLIVGVLLTPAVLLADDAAGTSTHWAYVPPVRGPLPAVRDATWPRNAIDVFVLARLEAEGLTPSAEADRARLIRRVSLDLIGLPPSPEEVDAFLADTSPEAYEKVVTRLLASPHYGERWGWLWLDLARYADTNGYEKDARRTMWPYRDWVIDALNRNLPFDRFTIEQIAGDLLPDATLAQQVATGFHRNTMTNTEGGTDDEEFRVAAVVDRVNTTMAVWMGTTFGCAQCHTHKYDPFTQTEYYRLYAYLNSTTDHDRDDNAPVLDVPSAETAARAKRLQDEIAGLEKTLTTPTAELAAAQAAWEKRRVTLRESWQPLAPRGALSSRGATLAVLPDRSILVGGKLPVTDSYTVVVDTDLQAMTGFRLEALTDGSLPKRGPGRGDKGAFVVTGLAVTAAPLDGRGEARAVKLRVASATREDAKRPAALVLDGDAGSGWGVDGASGREASIVFELAEPVGAEGGTTLTFTIDQRSGAKRSLGRLRLSATVTPPPVRVWPVPDDVAGALATETRSDEQAAQVASFYRSIAPSLQSARDRVAQLKSQIPTFPTTLVMQELDKPRETRIQIRGNFLNLGEAVSAGAPSVLHRVPDGDMPERMKLARWLVSPENPLVGRVMMNRFWEQYFGTGLVATSEDFGTQGEPPSHPKLLDWLATELVRVGWDLKAMHRLIVTSATYRQASHVTPTLLERDPYNRLLARGPRVRLPAEMIRDRILAVSGLLSRKMYGPSVMPPQPEGVWQVVYSGDRWVTSENEDKYRRGLYTFWRRTSPHPAMTTFDAPSREVCVLRRSRTNTPLQALVLLNDPAYVEAAQALARRIVSEGGEDVAARITYGFRRCLTRRPEPAELDRLVAMYDQELEHFRRHEKDAIEMSGAVVDEDPASMAAWTVLANVLLNLDELVTKD
jgi:hypothetical protein